MLYVANYHPADANRDSGFDHESDGGRLCGTFAEAVNRIAVDAYGHHVANHTVAESGADVDDAHANRAIAYRAAYDRVQAFAATLSRSGVTIPIPYNDRVVYWLTLPGVGAYSVTTLREGDAHPCTTCGEPGRVTAIHSDRNGTQVDAFATCDTCADAYGDPVAETDAFLDAPNR
jgi:hypothetical protein